MSKHKSTFAPCFAHAVIKAGLHCVCVFVCSLSHESTCELRSREMQMIFFERHARGDECIRGRWCCFGLDAKTKCVRLWEWMTKSQEDVASPEILHLLYNTRSAKLILFIVPKSNSLLGFLSFQSATPTDWNHLQKKTLKWTLLFQTVFKRNLSDHVKETCCCKLVL